VAAQGARRRQRAICLAALDALIDDIAHIGGCKPRTITKIGRDSLDIPILQLL
jgi:hypothetical protein